MVKNCTSNNTFRNKAKVLIPLLKMFDYHQESSTEIPYFILVPFTLFVGLKVDWNRSLHGFRHHLSFGTKAAKIAAHISEIVEKTKMAMETMQWSILYLSTRT